MKAKNILPALILLLLFGDGVATASEISKEKEQLVNRLRTLYKATTAYIQDKENWPQCPFDETQETEKFSNWWKAEMKPYGLAEKSWNWEDQEQISFLPSRMKPGAHEAFRFVRPWFRTTFPVGDPPKYYAVFPDGSVKEVTKDGESNAEKSEATESRP